MTGTHRTEWEVVHGLACGASRRSVAGSITPRVVLAHLLVWLMLVVVPAAGALAGDGKGHEEESDGKQATTTVAPARSFLILTAGLWEPLGDWTTHPAYPEVEMVGGDYLFQVCWGKRWPGGRTLELAYGHFTMDTDEWENIASTPDHPLGMDARADYLALAAGLPVVDGRALTWRLVFGVGILFTDGEETWEGDVYDADFFRRVPLLMARSDLEFGITRSMRLLVSVPYFYARQALDYAALPDQDFQAVSALAGWTFLW